MFCAMCGKEIKEKVAFCPHCGVPQDSPVAAASEDVPTEEKSVAKQPDKERFVVKRPHEEKPAAKKGKGGLAAVIIAAVVAVVGCVLYFTSDSYTVGACFKKIPQHAHIQCLSEPPRTCEQIYFPRVMQKIPDKPCHINIVISHGTYFFKVLYSHNRLVCFSAHGIGN